MRDTCKQSRSAQSGFTLAEVMISIMIFAMVATAGTYMMGATATAQNFLRDGTSSQSEVEFALGRMVENVRAATAVTAGNTLTITSLPSALISNNTFTITYSLSGTNLVEKYVNNATSATYSSNTLVHNVTAFSVQEYSPTYPNTFTITLTAGTDQVVSRIVDVFGRNL